MRQAETLFNPQQNYSALRLLMSNIQVYKLRVNSNLTHLFQPPFVPLLSLTLTDLVFIDDGGADSPEGLVNCGKLLVRGHKISLLFDLSTHPYDVSCSELLLAYCSIIIM